MKVSDRGLWIESPIPMADSLLWTVPLRLVEAVATGRPAELGTVPPPLADRLPEIRDIYAAWIKGGSAVPLIYNRAPSAPDAPQGVSLFFSGGVDSYHSLVKHRDEIDQLILVHGFDIPLTETVFFSTAESLVRRAAQTFGKRLIVVRTNLHWDESTAFTGQGRTPCPWVMYYGAAMAGVAHALAPIHRKVYFASTYAYGELRPAGSHPLLDPLWSTDSLAIVHDGGERRIDKLRDLIVYPDILANLRVCWQSFARPNCGRCEKCVRTMLGLRALGVESCPAFPTPLTPDLVRSQALDAIVVMLWRELLDSDLPAGLKNAVRAAIGSCEAGLPPRTGKPRQELRRLYYASRNAARALRAAF